jgi:hypothetical protein
MLTKDQMRCWRPTSEMVEAAEAVFVCMAAVDMVKPIVLGYRAKILRELGWGSTDPERTYNLPDSVFAEYHRRCNEERIAAKLHVDDPDHCPYLVAKNLLCKAQRVLVDVMEPVVGISFDRIFQAPDALKNYDTLIDLNLRLLAPYCTNRLKEV